MHVQESNHETIQNMDIPLSDDFNCSFYNAQHTTGDTKTPFKIFIYNIPSKFNSDLSRCVNTVCHSLTHCGFGKQAYSEHGEISVRDTWQFALEIIIHMKLLASPYRTLDPSVADAFYLPFYVSFQGICGSRNKVTTSNYSDFAKPLEDMISSPYYKQGKLHFMTRAMPQL